MSKNSKPILDIPSENPGLGFDTYAVELADTIKKVPEGPLTVGILGDYGTGKTTLMKAILKELEQEDSILPVWFPAWRYDQAEEPLAIPLLSSIYKKFIEENAEVKSDETFKDKSLAAIKSIIRSTEFTIKTPVVEMKFDAANACTYEEEYLKPKMLKLLSDHVDIYVGLEDFLSEIFKTKSYKQVVVFIDDLDRCDPHKAAQMIEATKSFFEIKGLTFVIGLNRKSISKYLKAKFGEDFTNPDEYLQKIIQVPFYVPTPSTENLKEEVSALASSHSIEAGELLSILCESEFGNSPSLTIRDMKQLLNSYSHFPSFASEYSNQIFRLLIMRKLCPYYYKNIVAKLANNLSIDPTHEQTVIEDSHPETNTVEAYMKDEYKRYSAFLLNSFKELTSFKPEVFAIIN